MRKLTLVAFVTAVVLGVVHSAGATYPGANGKIAFSTDQDPNGNVDIYTVNPNGTGETQLTHGEFGHAGDPNWSPDGTKIVFGADGSGSLQLYVMSSTGAGGHLLLDDPGNDDGNPHYSPDGSTIAFSSCNGTGCTIKVVKSDGTGPVTQLTSSPWQAFDPGWSPDGRGSR